MKITFLGAAETVTGSKYLLTVENKKFLVDCGLFQGFKELRQRNWSKLPVTPSHINAVILTHAHIDHSGYIPLLVKDGFTGPVYCTHATQDLCEILLPDSGHLQEEEANFLNRHGYTKHKPALPLYTMQQAKNSLQQFQALNFGQSYQLFDELSFQFNRAGHILGAAMVLIKNHNLSLLFSGDLGRTNDPIMRPPVAISHIDYLVLESTYGNRLHEKVDPIDALEKIINRTIKRGGIILIPAFAVGRAQNIIYFIEQLIHANRIPRIPVFLDSPMAINATEIFCNHTSEHRLTPNQCQQFGRIATYINTIEDSKELDQNPTPKIIISASGMLAGGRILHHVKALGGNARNTILLTGFQASGTRGDKLLRGQREIYIFGEIVQINAEVVELNNTSAHADYEEMLDWLKKIQSPPRKVFITHGENEAAHALKNSIEETFGWNCVVPKYLQEEELT